MSGRIIDIRFWAAGLFAAALAGSLLGGCIRSDLPLCDSSYVLYIDIGDIGDIPTGRDEVSEIVDTATIFVFNPFGTLVEIKGVGREVLYDNQPVELEYSSAEHPTAIVWGNLRDAMELISPGDPPTMSDMLLILEQGPVYGTKPDNLYHARAILTGQGEQRIVIAPAMSRISVTARGLTTEPEEEFYFTAETRTDGYNFHCEPHIGETVLRVDAALNPARGDLVTTEPFLVFAYPQDNRALDPVMVALMKQDGGTGELIAQTDRDDRALEILPVRGMCVNVLLDFRETGELKVYLRITDWDVIEQWENW